MTDRGSVADRDALAVAVLAAHEALDAWAAAVREAADAHPADPDSATEAPALGAAEEAWDGAFDAFHEAAGRVLGYGDEIDELAEEALDDLDRDPEDAVGVELYATVTGAGNGEPLLLVDAEGEKLVEALEAAGFEVPEWGVRLVPVEDLSADDSLLDGDEADDGA
ncbi:MAG: hypothetical protein JWN88_3125 [Frankiales bacterium]|nr:hypothetical protein [Frankiales bacterium]